MKSIPEICDHCVGQIEIPLEEKGIPVYGGTLAFPGCYFGIPVEYELDKENTYEHRAKNIDVRFRVMNCSCRIYSILEALRAKRPNADGLDIILKTVQNTREVENALQRNLDKGQLEKVEANVALAGTDNGVKVRELLLEELNEHPSKREKIFEEE